MTDEPQDEDLIGQVMGGGEVPPGPSRQVEDMVSVLDAISLAHGKHCQFESYINPITGQVFCLSCGSNVGSVNDLSDAFCPKCGCANSCHLNGKCLMQGCPCDDSHEFQQTNLDRQSKEAKQWLAKRKQQFEATRTSSRR